MSGLYITLIIVVGIILVLLIYIIATYNRFVKLRNSCETAFSTMDVYLKKRWDLIPNLVETVKGYTKHEEGVLKEIVELRNSANNYSNLKNDDKVDLNNKLSQKIGGLLALVENYPDLKASDNFKNLNEQLASIENDIANARKYYNGTVKNLNTAIEMFPSNLVAKMIRIEKRKMFEANENERENVKVQF